MLDLACVEHSAWNRDPRNHPAIWYNEAPNRVKSEKEEAANGCGKHVLREGLGLQCILGRRRLAPAPDGRRYHTTPTPRNKRGTPRSAVSSVMMRCVIHLPTVLPRESFLLYPTVYLSLSWTNALIPTPSAGHKIPLMSRGSSCWTDLSHELTVIIRVRVCNAAARIRNECG